MILNQLKYYGEREEYPARRDGPSMIIQTAPAAAGRETDLPVQPRKENMA